jgi:hypothetical protein
MKPRDWTFMIVALVTACAPKAVPNAYSVPFQSLPSTEAVMLSEPFQATLTSLGIVLNISESKVFRYEGTDDRSFLAAVDRFYLESPGFCPLEKAFYPGANNISMTLAAKSGTTQVRAFMYNLSTRPKLVFAYIFGTSRNPLKTAPCHTVETP